MYYELLRSLVLNPIASQEAMLYNYRSSDKRRIVVPIHLGKDIKRKTLYGIIKDMGIEVEEFIELL